ncbi:polyketide cyclase [Streptomyces spiroverticillatus]|uniref:Polyketide cyclase n=1 Tax=Streptomyces finlayi TaxID=67296 RepID=A0A918X908_9ACTN|nr:SRPBCC family protein [Streptomyces finlayi]GHA48752.1 polyketide cyclase [Streptomyces spiroverticillatus]GHD19086.1 polyketide cyclase [Streptomyces finlayi]
MVRQLRGVGLDFAETAPVRLVFAAEVAAAPEDVYRALAEETAQWPRWFTAVTFARPTTEGREVHLKGGTKFMETVVAAEPGERYAYRIDLTNAPGLTAMLEEWRIRPAGAGTRVQWTMAVDGPAPLRLVLRTARPGVGRSFRDAVRTLDRRLAARDKG